MLPATGQKAPEFCLLNQDKKEICLGSLRGKNVVLLFFPLAFTSTCTAELCHVRDTHAMYGDLNALVFGISVDSHFALARFREDQRLNFDLLSDFNKTASASYGCLYDTFRNMRGVSKRAAFVIDSNGVLRHSEVLEDASQQPDYAKILTCIESLN